MQSFLTRSLTRSFSLFFLLYFSSHLWAVEDYLTLPSFPATLLNCEKKAEEVKEIIARLPEIEAIRSGCHTDSKYFSAFVAYRTKSKSPVFHVQRAAGYPSYEACLGKKKGENGLERDVEIYNQNISKPAIFAYCGYTSPSDVNSFIVGYKSAVKGKVHDFRLRTNRDSSVETQTLADLKTYINSTGATFFGAMRRGQNEVEHARALYYAKAPNKKLKTYGMSFDRHFPFQFSNSQLCEAAASGIREAFESTSPEFFNISCSRLERPKKPVFTLVGAYASNSDKAQIYAHGTRSAGGGCPKIRDFLATRFDKAHPQRKRLFDTCDSNNGFLIVHRKR